MNANTLNHYNHLITSFCFSLFLLGIALYMYFLSLSVMHVVMRKEEMHDLNELKSEIAKLDASYIEARHKISTQVASVDGFQANDDKIFIGRSSERGLTINSVR